jgi:hypothetical protein
VTDCFEEAKNPFLMKRGTNSDDEQLLTERKQKPDSQEPLSYSDSKQNSTQSNARTLSLDLYGEKLTGGN